MVTLAIRTELIEQGLFPMQARFNQSVLINLFTNLNLLSSIDYKIKLHQWVDQAIKHIPGFTEKEAEVYFLTYRALLGDIENGSNNAHRELPLADYPVDVRCFALYIALQLYTASAKQATESRNNLAKDTWGVKESTTMSQSGASPRSKYTKINYTQSEYQIILHFIKTNLKLFLRVASTEIHNPEISLSSNEFNSLRILFRIRQPGGTKPGQTLSSITPFFQAGGPQVKVHMGIISEWLVQNLATSEPEDEVIYMNGLNKCVTIREGQVQNKDVRILGCEDSYIYIDTNVQFMQISNCVNCTIMVAAVNTTCSIDKCENVTLCIATNFIRIGNCVDCTVHSYTQICPPVIYGDTRNLVMAPHNLSYFELMTHLRAADLIFVAPGSQVSNKVAQEVNTNIQNFAKPIQMIGQDDNFLVMQPVDFMKMSLPKKFNEHQLFLCPQEYIEVLQLRLEHFASIQSQIKSAHLSNEQEKMLHVAIQGYFREWFVQSGHYKPITELVRMIDQEF